MALSATKGTTVPWPSAAEQATAASITSSERREDQRDREADGDELAGEALLDLVGLGQQGVGDHGQQRTRGEALGEGAGAPAGRIAEHLVAERGAHARREHD